jgi:RHS repeat-associated protein
VPMSALPLFALLPGAAGTRHTVKRHHNANGNVANLTNPSGVVVEKYKYDAFGKPTITDGSGNPLTASAYGNRFLFTGREYLAEVNLYDYRNRVYSADLGRFLQTDPLRFSAGDVNIYRYCENNPINGIDPFGTENWSWSTFGRDTAVGAGAGALGGGAVALATGGAGLPAVGAGALGGGVVGAATYTGNYLWDNTFDDGGWWDQFWDPDNVLPQDHCPNS